jgi:hypothetical protein
MGSKILYSSLNYIVHNQVFLPELRFYENSILFAQVNIIWSESFFSGCKAMLDYLGVAFAARRDATLEWRGTNCNPLRRDNQASMLSTENTYAPQYS